MLSLAVALTSLACGAGPDRETPRSDVVVAVPVGPQHFDPDEDVDEFTASIHGNTYEWLTGFDANQRPQPQLAERWSTLDDRTWLFELRKGVRFHDGRALDAHAAAEAVRRSLRSRGGAQARGIESVEVRGEHEIVIRTLEPRAAVIDVADVPIALEPLSGSGHLVGTGAYTIVSGEVLGDVRLRAFPHHWAGPPSIETLTFRVIANERERLQALADGEVNLVVNVTADGARSVGEAAGGRIVTHGSLRVIVLGLVTSAGGGLPDTPFADPRVRRAVAYALDRPALVKDALGGYGEVLDQIVTPAAFGYAPDLKPIPYEPETSRALLAEAGFARGLTIAMSYPRARYQAIDRVAAVLAAQLGEVGIAVTLAPLPPESVARRESSTPAFLLGWITTRTAAATYDQLVHTRIGGRGISNLSRYSDARVDAALRTARESSFDTKRERLFDVGRRLRETLPMVPLYRQFDLYAVADGLVFQPRLQRIILGRELHWETSASPADS